MKTLAISFAGAVSLWVNMAMAGLPGEARPLPQPITTVGIYTITGGWGKDARYPSVAAPISDGETTGKLEDAFDVKWERRGEDFKVAVTRLNQPGAARSKCFSVSLAQRRALPTPYRTWR